MCGFDFAMCNVIVLLFFECLYQPKRYYLSEAFALIAQYGSLEAAEAALTEARDATQG